MTDYVGRVPRRVAPSRCPRCARRGDGGRPGLRPLRGRGRRDLRRGSPGSDARSFAASLAAERGIIPASPSPAKTRRRPLVLVAFTVIAALVLIFAARALLTGQPKATLVANVSGTPGHHLPSATPFPFAPPGGAQRVFDLGNLAAPIEWILLVFAVVALGFALWLWSSWARSATAQHAGLASFRGRSLRT